jgi:molecular chaperone GrpE
MVNMNNDNEEEIELKITDEESTNPDETDLVDVEEKTDNKIKKIKEKLNHCEDERKKLLDETQRAKADFLNARKRLEEARLNDQARNTKNHIEKLLPLCDSFQMAMQDEEVWNKADESWRKGIEGIYTQLKGILSSYGVEEVDPTGNEFDPHLHEAVSTEETSDKEKQDKVITVIQKGYLIKTADKEETIRPARVTIGTVK